MPEQGEMFGDRRKMFAGNRFQIVVTDAGVPAGRVDPGGVADKFGGAKNHAGGDIDRRMQYQIVAGGQGDVGKVLADALGKRVLPMDEHRDVGAQAEPDFFQRGAV